MDDVVKADVSSSDMRKARLSSIAMTETSGALFRCGLALFRTSKTNNLKFSLEHIETCYGTFCDRLYSLQVEYEMSAGELRDLGDIIDWSTRLDIKWEPITDIPFLRQQWRATVERALEDGKIQEL